MKVVTSDNSLNVPDCAAPASVGTSIWRNGEETSCTERIRLSDLGRLHPQSEADGTITVLG